MFADFLNHRCNIFHLIKLESSPGWGLPAASQFTYGEHPDIHDVPCHFCVGSSTNNVIQGEPQADYEAKIKLVLPVDIDIRVNDKIVDAESGYEYTSGIPIKIRNHHKFVYIKRTEKQEAL